MARVTLEGVRKVYDNGFVAVHGVDLVVEDGEFVVLVGPSGSGKSTTLRIIAGLESVSAGELHTEGGTNVYAGLQLGLSQLNADRATSIILVTDGVANQGIVDPREFRKLVKQYDVRVFGFTHAAKSRDHDGRNLRISCERFVEHATPVHAGQSQVRDEDVERELVQAIERFFPCSGLFHAISDIAEPLGNHLPKRHFIVD